MKKVIEHKKAQVLEVNDYYQYDKYEKMKMSTISHRKNWKKGFIRNILSERSGGSFETTNKPILPISGARNSFANYLPQRPSEQKDHIKGKTLTVSKKVLPTRDMLGTVLKDVFADINIYEDDIRLLQQRFVSPISR